MSDQSKRPSQVISPHWAQRPSSVLWKAAPHFGQLNAKTVGGWAVRIEVARSRLHCSRR